VLADRGRRISLKDVAKLAVKTGWDHVIVDGTHVPAVTFGRKTAGQKAFYSGKHKRHGLNVQTVCSPDGELPRAAPPRPGATVAQMALIGRAVIWSPSGNTWGPVWNTTPPMNRSPSGRASRPSAWRPRLWPRYSP
jgi:hypothetical protein